MDKDKLQELLDARAHQEQQRVQTEQELEKLRTPMTILFSDIKGSTQYAEKKGDVEYMSMINRHNRLLFPVIEGEGGTVVDAQRVRAPHEGSPVDPDHDR